MRFNHIDAKMRPVAPINYIGAGKMIDVTFALEEVKHHVPSGITYVQLHGDDGFEWVLAKHPDTPDGFVSICGVNNSSFRLIQKELFERMLNAGTP